MGDLHGLDNADVVASRRIAQQHSVLHGAVPVDQTGILVAELSDDVVALGTQLASIGVRYSNHVFRCQFGQYRHVTNEAPQVITASYMQTVGALSTAVRVYQLLIHEHMRTNPLSHLAGVAIHEYPRVACRFQTFVHQDGAIVGNRQLAFLHESQQIGDRVVTFGRSYTLEETLHTDSTTQLGSYGLNLDVEFLDTRDQSTAFRHNSDHSFILGHWQMKVCRGGRYGVRHDLVYRCLSLSSSGQCHHVLCLVLVFLGLLVLVYREIADA